MRLIGLTLARNEAWILGLSARVALQWCDEMVFLDHASTDETPAILAALAGEYPGRVHVIRETGDTWHEMEHRQRTLDAGRDLGGTHFAIVDADEILTANAAASARAVVAHLWPGSFLSTSMYAMWRGTDKYRHDNSVWSNRQDLVLAFRDNPGLHWQAVGGYDHHQRAPLNSFPVGAMQPGGVMHMQFASWRRLRAKHAWYKCTERIRWPQKNVAEIDWMYSLACNEQGAKFAKAPVTWWAQYQPWMGHLRLEHEPWHEAAVRAMVADKGRDYFAGLDLYGIA